MRKEATIEFKITCHAAPLQIEGAICNDQDERRPFYFRNRNGSIYCIMGDWTDLVPEEIIGSAYQLMKFVEKNSFSIRQTVPTDKNGFASEISLKEALKFVMMTHELSL